MIEGGNQPVYTFHKNHIRCYSGLIVPGVFPVRRRLPVILQGLELFLLIVMARGVLQFRTEDGGAHLIKQPLIASCRGRRPADDSPLHTQRTGFINGVGTALNAMHQA